MTPRPLDELLDAFFAAVADRSLVALVLSKPAAGGDDLQRVTIRRVVLRGEDRLAFVHRHATRDVTKNTTVAAARVAIEVLLDLTQAPAFAHATLRTAALEWQLRSNRKGRATLVRKRAATPVDAPAACDAHDRAKQRRVDLDAPWLKEVGIVDARGRVVPAMADKLRQIDRFVEVFEGAWLSSALADRRALRVFDFGCGKGALTFAVFDHLRQRGVEAEVVGIELRAGLVESANRNAERVGFAARPGRAGGLRFEQGDLRTTRPGPMDVTIALHACDTATDDALALGALAGAHLLIASPCCHRQLRPQLRWPEALAPLLRHGVHAGQEAEMLTDSLRVLALEASGYAAKAFEFVSPEHTAKNKMILAVRRAPPSAASAAKAVGEFAALKAFWGIREQALEGLLLSRERS